MRNSIIAAAAAGMLTAHSADADIQFAINPTGANNATITGSGALDTDLEDVVGFILTNPSPLDGADDGVGDSLSGDLALGAVPLSVLSTQGTGDIQLRFGSAFDFLAGDALTGMSDLSFDSETIAPIGTNGQVLALLASSSRGPGGLEQVGTYSIVPTPSSAAILCFSGLAAARRRR